MTLNRIGREEKGPAGSGTTLACGRMPASCAIKWLMCSIASGRSLLRRAWKAAETMTNAGWWVRVVQARTRHADLLPQRMWTLRKGAQEAAIDLRAVPGVGAEIVLSVDGELRRTRLYRAHEQAELSGAIADTRARFEAKGWEKRK
jgi:hypothetical protein